MSTESTYTAEHARYARENRDKIAIASARARDKLRDEMVIAYGGECKHCGINNPIMLCLDHINGDAHIEKELFGENRRGGYSNYARLKIEGWPKERFQLLCYNCNAVKEHQRRRALLGKRWGEPEAADRHLVQAKLPPSKNNSSGFKGVFWNTQQGKWHAKIMTDGKTRHLGYFIDIAEAARAYKAAALQQWGLEANVPSEEEILEIAARTGSKPQGLVVNVNLNAKDLGL